MLNDVYFMTANVNLHVIVACNMVYFAENGAICQYL